MDITIYNVQSRKGGKYIGLELKKDSPEHQLIKTCKEKWWSGACKLWLVASRQDSWAEVRERFAGYHFVKSEATVSIEEDPWLSTQKKSPAKTAAARETISLNEHQQEALNKLKEALILKQYQYSTLKSYCNNFVGFMLYYKERGVQTLNHEDIRRYLLFKIREHKISESSQNSIVNAIKFYYEVVEKWEKFVVYDLRPKPAHKLPGFLSKEDTVRLLKATENLKHRAILQLIYSSGMRLGELTRLKVRDVRFDMDIIEIKCAKGKKDRISMLSAKVKTLLEEYIAMYKPRYWMFEGQTGGKYSDRSVQQILRKAVIKSGVDENTTVHTLRHCFATHLILNGVDIRIVQEYLGHASTKTTEIYTHITDKLKTKIKSPLDDLDF